MLPAAKINRAAGPSSVLRIVPSLLEASIVPPTAKRGLNCAGRHARAAILRPCVADALHIRLCDLAAELILDVVADDVLEAGVGLEAERECALRRKLARPAGHDLLDERIGL